MDQVEEAMRIHTAFTDAARPGGFEAPMVELVRRFDCSLLQARAGDAPQPVDTPEPATDSDAAGDAVETGEEAPEPPSE
jgi:hypothetical protein